MKNKLLGLGICVLISGAVSVAAFAADEGLTDVAATINSSFDTVQTGSQSTAASPIVTSVGTIANEGNVNIKGLNGLDVKINYTDDIPAVCELAKFTEKTEGIVFDENVGGYVYKITTKNYTLAPAEVKSLFYKLPDVTKPCVLDVSAVYDVQSTEETNDTNWEFRDELNGYLKTKIIIKVGERNLKVTPNAIKDWVVIDNQNLTASVDKNKVWVYVDGLSKMFNTSNRARNFATTNSGTVSIAAGTYGWKTDFTGVTDKLYEAIRNKSDITLTVGCSQSGYGMPNEMNDFGNTYVEISIPKQHMWVYKDGNIVLESDVVTGNPTLGRDTPVGAYFVKSRTPNAVLVGANYRTPVAFWMPFTNNGCGLHDATWQPWFGGNRYISNGSHGCVNLPYDVAKQLFDTVTVGYPVIVY